MILILLYSNCKLFSFKFTLLLLNQMRKYYMLITPTYHHHFLFYAVYHLNHTLIWLVFVLSAAVWDLFY